MGWVGLGLERISNTMIDLNCLVKSLVLFCSVELGYVGLEWFDLAGL